MKQKFQDIDSIKRRLYTTCKEYEAKIRKISNLESRVSLYATKQQAQESFDKGYCALPVKAWGKYALQS